MNNAEWCIKQGYKFRELTCKCSKTGNYDYDILLNNKCIGTVKDSYSNRAITTWLDMEHVEPILDDAERKYLSAVIEPFKDYVWFIRKVNSEKNYGYQKIVIDLIDDSEPIALPLFKEDTMYKGMEVDKEYTVKELGL